MYWFVFLLLYIYRRHLFQFGKMWMFPNLHIYIGKNIIIYSNKTFLLKCSHSKKPKLFYLTLFNQIFGKYLEQRKEITRFAWSKSLLKYKTLTIYQIFYGHELPSLSYFNFATYYSDMKYYSYQNHVKMIF